MHPRKAPPQGIEGMQECIQECIRARTPVGPTMQNASESARGDGAPRPSSCAPTRAQPNAPDAVSGRTARPLHAAQAPAPGSTRRVRRGRDCRAALALSAFPEQLGVSPIGTSSPAAARPARPRLSPHPHIHARRMPLPFINHTIRRLRNSPPTFSHWQAHSTIADEGKLSQVEGSDCR